MKKKPTVSNVHHYDMDEKCCREKNLSPIRIVIDTFSSE